MSTRIQDIASVSFALGDVSVTQASFNKVLILDETVRTGTRVSTYTSISEMEADGYVSTDLAHIMATGLFAQTSKDGKRVESVKVGQKKVDNDCVISVTFDADASAGTFTLTFGGGTTGAIAYDALTSAVETAIEAVAGITACTVALNTGAVNPGDKEGFTITFDGADATNDFTLSAVDVSALTGVATATIDKQEFGLAVETYSAAYTAIKASDNDFYFVLPTTVTKADILEFAAIVEADSDHKLALYTTRDSAVLGATADNVAEEMKDLNYKRAVTCYTDDSDKYLSGNWLGAFMPDKAYAVNTCYYPLTGIDASTLSSTNITNLETNNVNRLESIGGYSIVPGTSSGNSGNKGGLVASGSFIDQIVAKDYLEARVSERLYALLISNKVIPFTQAGSDLIKGVIESALITYGVNEGIIVDLTKDSVVMPDLATYSSTKKAARWFDGITGGNTLTGAVSKISVNITLAS